MDTEKAKIRLEKLIDKNIEFLSRADIEKPIHTVLSQTAQLISVLRLLEDGGTSTSKQEQSGSITSTAVRQEIAKALNKFINTADNITSNTPTGIYVVSGDIFIVYKDNSKTYKVKLNHDTAEEVA